MTIQIYRAYRDALPQFLPGEHYFSIVADEHGATYALPPELDAQMWMNQDRMDALLHDAKATNTPLPTTPLGWARFACQSMPAWNVVLHVGSPTDEPYENIEDAVNSEISDAQDSLEIRKESNITPDGSLGED